jgi:hypothetical protein
VAREDFGCLQYCAVETEDDWPTWSRRLPKIVIALVAAIADQIWSG